MIEQRIIINEHDVIAATVAKTGEATTLEIDGISLVLTDDAAWHLAERLCEAARREPGGLEWAATINAGECADHIEIGEVDPEINRRWSACWLRVWSDLDHEPARVVELDPATIVALATELITRAATSIRDVPNEEIQQVVRHDVTYWRRPEAGAS